MAYSCGALAAASLNSAGLNPALHICTCGRSSCASNNGTRFFPSGLSSHLHGADWRQKAFRAAEQCGCVRRICLTSPRPTPPETRPASCICQQESDPLRAKVGRHSAALPPPLLHQSLCFEPKGPRCAAPTLSDACKSCGIGLENFYSCMARMRFEATVCGRCRRKSGDDSRGAAGPDLSVHE